MPTPSADEFIDSAWGDDAPATPGPLSRVWNRALGVNPWSRAALSVGLLGILLGSLGLWLLQRVEFEVILTPFPQFALMGAGVLLAPCGIVLATIAIVRHEGLGRGLIAAAIALLSILPALIFVLMALRAVAQF